MVLLKETLLTSFNSNAIIIGTGKPKNSTDNNLNDNVITFMTRIPYSFNVKEGAIILNVDSKIVSDLLKNITAGDANALAFIVNEKGKILASCKDRYLYRNIKNVISITQQLFMLNSGKYSFSFNNIRMISYFESSNINNWKLVYTVSENVVYEKSRTIRNITILTCVFLLLIMIIVSLVLSFKVYNPIKQLIANIKLTMKINNEDSSDILIIQNSLNQLFENNKSLEVQVNQNKQLVSERFLSNLITGKLFNKSAIKSKAEYLQIELESDCFKVAVIQISSILSEHISVEGFELNKIVLLNIVHELFGNLHINVICSQDPNDNILILFKLDTVQKTNETDAIIEQALEDIKDNIEKLLNLSISIGIGRTYSEVSNIGVSYKEAMEALQFKFLKGEHSVIHICDINPKGENILYYPIDKEQKLISLIKLRDYDKVIHYLNDILDDIMDHNKNFEHIGICLSNLISAIQRCIYELNLNAESVFGEKGVFNISIEQFKNIQQFIEWVSTKLRKIIEYHIDLEKDSTKSFSSEIKDYIKKKYMEEISLTSVANHFNYNSSYFCKIFKEKTGVSFWEYVANIRIEKSNKLLVETEESIEQIAGLVGYNNRFSYIRAFKKYALITPGEFRVKYNGK